VPKIRAATVAEHRAQQREALVEAARRLLIAGGYEAVSFPALAEQTGLARPSVYSYFGSKDDIVVAVCEASLPAWLTRADEAMARARSPRSKLVAFVRAQLEAAAAGEHRVAVAVEHAPLSPESWARIGELHEKFAPRVSGVIASLGHRHPEMVADLVQGVVAAAVARIDAGEPPARVIRAATDLVLHGLDPRSSAAD
jgi:AcrR family transcriptional regulator